MKKLMMAVAVLAACVTGAFAASTFVYDVSAASQGKTLTLEFNSYGSNYQITPDFTYLIKAKKPKAGDTVEIYMKGTSNVDLPYIRVDLVDPSPAANYWTLLNSEADKERLIVTDVKAGVPFEGHISYVLANSVKAELKLVMRYDDEAICAANGFAKVEKEAKIKFEKVVNSTDYSKVKARKPKNIKVDVTQIMKLIEIKPDFDDSGRLAWYQAIFNITDLFGDELPIKGDTITLTYKGTCDIAIPEIKMTLVDTSQAAGWWRDLVSNGSDKFYTWMTDIEPGKVFKASVTVPITVPAEQMVSVQMYFMPFDGAKAATIKFAK